MHDQSMQRLHFCMLCYRFRAHSVKPETSVLYNLQGDEVDRSTAFQSELMKKYGKGPFLLGWHEIRQIIFDSLPPGVVEFNSQVSTVLPVFLLALGADINEMQMGQVGVANIQASVTLPICLLALLC